MKPKIGILNPRFKYTRAEETDIRRSFRKEKARLAKDRERAETQWAADCLREDLDPLAGVVPLIISDGTW